MEFSQPFWCNLTWGRREGELNQEQASLQPPIFWITNMKNICNKDHNFKNIVQVAKYSL